MTSTSTDERIVVVTEPRPGTVIEIPAGSQLGVRFRRGIGPSQWRIADRPAHLLPLLAGGHEFQFLVFGSADAPTAPLRLERGHPDRPSVHEVCELVVVPVHKDLASTSGSASRRTA